jgi:hypothetical protein
VQQDAAMQYYIPRIVMDLFSWIAFALHFVAAYNPVL